MSNKEPKFFTQFNAFTTFTGIRMDIDELAAKCGYFTDCETNNGYGCSHPRNEGGANGGCHRIGCPLAWYDSDKDEMVLYHPDLWRQREILRRKNLVTSVSAQEATP